MVNHVLGYRSVMVNYGSWLTNDHMVEPYQKTVVQPWLFGYGLTIWSVMLNHGQPWLTILFFTIVNHRDRSSGLPRPILTMFGANEAEENEL